jgi:hypothetical protein
MQRMHCVSIYNMPQGRPGHFNTAGSLRANWRRHERCAAAHAAYSAESDSDMATQLSCAKDDAIDALAEMPCASDAEFFEKLRFLLARETHLWGSPAGNMEFGSIALSKVTTNNNAGGIAATGAVFGSADVTVVDSVASNNHSFRRRGGLGAAWLWHSSGRPFGGHGEWYWSERHVRRHHRQLRRQ